MPKRMTFDKPSKNVNVAAIPPAFDARVQWSYCPSLQMVRNEGNCWGGWAIAPSDVMSDRICISTQGAMTPIISPKVVMTCGHTGNPQDRRASFVNLFALLF